MTVQATHGQILVDVLTKLQACVLIWRVLDSLVHHLLLIMIHDYLLAICHKKGEYILMEIGGVLEFWSFWSFGALDCISRSFMYFLFYLAHDVFICIC